MDEMRPENQRYWMSDLNAADDLKSERARNLREMGVPAEDEPLPGSDAPQLPVATPVADAWGDS